MREGRRSAGHGFPEFMLTDFACSGKPFILSLPAAMCILQLTTSRRSSITSLTIMYRIGSIVVLCGFLIGCGGSTQPIRIDYDMDLDRTVYRARATPIPVDMQGAGYGSQFQELRMNLWANCQGRACRPEEAQFTLSTSGGADLHIGDRSLLIVADGERFLWEDPEHERRNLAERTVGMILQVSIGFDRLQKIANAEELDGRVGSIDLEIQRRGQDRIRAFVAEVKGESGRG